MALNGDELARSGVCRVCGERVTALMAPLHIEDHKQRGEFPSATPGREWAVSRECLALCWMEACGRDAQCDLESGHDGPHIDMHEGWEW